MGLVLILLCIGLLTVSTPCVDINGCFKQHCQLKWFYTDYKEIIIKAHNYGMNQ